jgi:hypothetical protein
MAPREESRRERLTIQARDPTGEGTCEVYISHQRIQAMARRSVGQVKECGYIVPAILQQPTAVFEGLRRDQDDDPWGVGWRCYCGLPSCSYQPDGTVAKPYRGQVFLVFVNDEGVAYNWRWEKADADNLELPKDHETRFTRRLL